MEPFKIHILGCGSALPTLHHFSSMQVVECRGKLFMIDCGEGAQIQLRRAGISFERLGHIFISHLHGDHCFGLIGLICSFALSGRKVPLHIYAPVALKRLLDDMLAMFAANLEFEVAFHPVDTTVAQVIYEDSAVTVSTLPLQHRIPCCGYLFREKPTLPHIRRDMIDFYQIPVCQINNIKAGFDWITAEGETVPNSKLVEAADQPRSYAYCSDTRYIPTLHERIRGVTALYHESTYGEDNLLMAEKYYHSTARQAALVARDAGAGKLLLGHYSSRYEDENVLLNEAKQVFENSFLCDEQMVFEL
jgi:ribonuclease Z